MAYDVLQFPGIGSCHLFPQDPDNVRPSLDVGQHVGPVMWELISHCLLEHEHWAVVVRGGDGLALDVVEGVVFTRRRVLCIRLFSIPPVRTNVLNRMSEH